MKRAPDSIERMLFFRHVSDDGQTEMGVYAVMFGFRIRAARIDGQPEVDLCAGDDQDEVNRIFAAVASCIDNGIDLRSLPKQARKPMRNDPECMAELLKLAGPHEPIETTPIGIIKAIALHLVGIR